MRCPTCLTDLPDIAVRGRRYRLRRRTHIKQRYIEAENGEYLYCQPIPVLVIETKERKYATPKVSTRHSPVQKLPENVPAHRRSKVPVLQEAARESAGEIERNF